MIDHRRFLDDRRQEVLPYLGGPVVDARDRRLRVAGRVDPGWIEFEIEGRTARPVAEAARPELSDLPAVHGHALGDYLVHADARAELLFLAEGAEAAMFAPLTARRWPSGVLLFDTHDFETGAEEVARRAVRGAPHALRSERRSLTRAGGLRLRRRDAPRSGAGHTARARGDPRRMWAVSPTAGTTLRRRCSTGSSRSASDSASPRRVDLGRAPMLPSRLSDDERIEGAITAAGGQLLATQVRGDAVEVRFLLRGERFSSLVRPGSLQVLDAGICLSGEDRLITIESLPSVIIEGLETGQLVMTRRT